MPPPCASDKVLTSGVIKIRTHYPSRQAKTHNNTTRRNGLDCHHYLRDIIEAYAHHSVNDWLVSWNLLVAGGNNPTHTHSTQTHTQACGQRGEFGTDQAGVDAKREGAMMRTPISREMHTPSLLTNQQQCINIK